MTIKNINRWESTKKQIDDIILTAYTDMYKKCISYIREYDCPQQYIAYITRDLADAIISSYPEDKNNSLNLSKF